jgi:hypothetical protein
MNKEMKDHRFKFNLSKDLIIFLLENLLKGMDEDEKSEHIGRIIAIWSYSVDKVISDLAVKRVKQLQTKGLGWLDTEEELPDRKDVLNIFASCEKVWVDHLKEEFITEIFKMSKKLTGNKAIK